MHTPSMGRWHFRRVVEIEGRKTLMWAPAPASAVVLWRL
jgi:hypothetical protein